MSDIRISEERRQQKRFKAEEGAFAALVDQESRKNPAIWAGFFRM
jgi:hypothetical protein